MTPRLNPLKAAPGAMKAMVALESDVQKSGLDPSLIDLVKTRASRRHDEGAPAFLRDGTGQPDAVRRCDQPMEPHCDQPSRGSSDTLD